MPVFKTPEEGNTPLHKVLLRAVPENEHGNQTLTELARLLGIERYSVQKWLKAQHVPARRVKRIIEISNGQVTEQDLSPFVYN